MSIAYVTYMTLTVCFDLQPTYDKLLAEVPKYKLITQSVLSDRLRVSSLLEDFTSSRCPKLV